MATPSTLELRDRILQICGQGRTLLCGRHVGELLQCLLSHGIDAHAIDLAEQDSDAANGGYFGRLTRGSNLLALPWADDSFDTTVAIFGDREFSDDEVPRVLAELRRASKRSVFLRFERPDGVEATRGRAWWEIASFKAGLRKHPDYYHATGYAELENNHAAWDIPLEVLPDECAARFPLEVLQRERDLHMDMTRETGTRSDAHVYRYHLAASYIRAGDVVLDAACGLGYGSHVLKRTTRASSVIGIDNSEYAIDYAACSFPCRGLSFELGSLPECLASIPDASVDAIVSFETLEHVPNPERVLDEFRRILTPGGRLVASVPNDWREADGRDPNPFHMSVYEGASFRAEISRFFDIESFFAQTANRAKRLDQPLVWEVKPRAMVKLSADHDLRVSAEWWLALAAKPVAAGRTTPFVDRVWNEQQRLAAGHALAFGRDYENAWLVRSMVSIGLRTETPALLAQWAQEAADAPLGSADRGAGICIRAYQCLNQPPAPDSNVMEEINAYLGGCVTNPNVLRWHVSLSFAAALLALRTGDRDQAKRYFAKVLELPAVDYSPTLLTKTAEAAWRLGLLHAADGDLQAGVRIWQDAARKLCRELGGSFQNPPDQIPPMFMYREIADVVAIISRLFSAADSSAYFPDAPRQFWYDVDGDNVAVLSSYRRWSHNFVRQFYSLEGENEALRAELCLRCEQGERDFLEQQIDVIALENDRLMQHAESRTYEAACLRTQIAELAREKSELTLQTELLARDLALSEERAREERSRTVGWKLRREWHRLVDQARRGLGHKRDQSDEPPSRRAA